jgi:Carboxypeptidase regulatory-like domain
MKIILGLCLLMLVSSPGAFSQAVSGYGAVTGTVRDPYGDGLPDTVAVITNSSIGLTRNLVTTDDGVFFSPDLPPGSGYTLRLTHSGYSTFLLHDLMITVGETMNFKIVLPVLPPNARAQPAPTYSVADAVKFDLSAVVSPAQVDALPTDDRRPASLAVVAPAVSEAPTGVLAFRGEDFTNAFLLDGVLASNTYFYQIPGVAPLITQDAVAEMQVLVASGSAEFGHSAGGVLNIATHGGNDGYHGAAYGYYNNQDFNAANRFDPAFHPTTKMEQYGISAGGPGVSKMFWFVNGEVLQSSSQSINLLTNPLIGNAAGTAVAPSNCGSPATAAQCAAAIAFINPQLNRVVPTALRSDNGFARLDYRLTPANNFSFEGGAMQSHSPNGSVDEQVSTNNQLLGNNGTYTDETRFGKASYTATPAGNAVNEIRAAWYHDRFSDYTNPSLLPTDTGALGITIAGTPIGGNPNYPMVISEQRWQFLDHLTAAVGTHLLTFGGEYIRNQDKTAQIYAKAGSYDFPSLTAFAEDLSGNTLQHRDYTDFNQGFGQPVVPVKTQQIVGYAQDVWRPLPRLTVEGGVHWEKTLFSAPAFTSGSFYETGSIPSTSTNFNPRAGIAYQLDGNTVVRLGFGSYSQPYSGQLLESLYTGNGVNQASLTLLPNQTGNLAFPKIYSPTIVATSFASGAQNIVFPLNKFRNPYSEQATLAIERSLGRDTTVSVGVDQTRGVRLFTQIDENPLNWTYTKVYTIANSAGVPTGNYYFSSMWTAKATGTNFQHVYQIDDFGASKYNAAFVQVRKRMSHGLAVQGSYTWSHAIDNVSGPPAVGGSVPSDLIPGDYRDDQGNSNYNQRHRVVVNWTWQPTVTTSDSPMARFVLNGWQISGIATLASGLPETPVLYVNGQQFASGTNNGSASITMLYVNSLNGSGGWNRVPFEDVNSLQNGAQYVVNARVAKVLPFTDRIRGVVGFEAFNVFNNQYSTSLDTIAYTATAGVLRPVPGVGTATAADGFPYGTNARRAQVALRIVF